MKDEYEKRFSALSYLSRRNTRTLTNYLNKEPSKRQWGLKPDGSEITQVDYSIGLRSFVYINRHFPTDSINSEEIPMLRPSSGWEFGEDPVDVTSDARRYDKTKPGEHEWASYMASYTLDGEPTMFGLGIPVRNLLYYGSTRHGIYCNDVLMQPIEAPNSEILIGVNDEKFTDFIKEKTGHTNAYLASVFAWLTLNKLVGGGILLNKRPYEVNCILAIARINGATITDEKGNNFRADTKPSYAVWSYPHIDHNILLKQVT